jgi:2',3'-cyclic-nucleotide 2'-phosphodiesterase (5'-nucleotidase family)
LNKKIGYVNFDLLINSDEQSSRSGENPLCNLIADSIRYYGKGDITMINAGSIRNDLKKGDITFQNILEVLPFSAYIITKEVKGEDILNALEFGMKDLPEKTSRFPQVSGISFKVNTKIKSSVIVDEEEMFVKVSGKRRVYDVIVGKDKLDINKTYLIAFDNYIGKGGDGFSMFINYEEKLNLGKTDNELFMMYIRDVLNGVIPDEYKKTQQRIIIEENE